MILLRKKLKIDCSSHLWRFKLQLQRCHAHFRICESRQVSVIGKIVWLVFPWKFFHSTMYWISRPLQSWQICTSTTCIQARRNVLKYTGDIGSSGMFWNSSVTYYSRYLNHNRKFPSKLVSFLKKHRGFVPNVPLVPPGLTPQWSGIGCSLCTLYRYNSSITTLPSSYI